MRELMIVLLLRLNYEMLYFSLSLSKHSLMSNRIVHSPVQGSAWIRQECNVNRRDSKIHTQNDARNNELIINDWWTVSNSVENQKGTLSFDCVSFVGNSLNVDALFCFEHQIQFNPAVVNSSKRIGFLMSSC